MKHPIDELLQRIYGVSDEDILREFDEAEVMGEDGQGADPEGFERLWQNCRGSMGKTGINRRAPAGDLTIKGDGPQAMPAAGYN